ncbi:MAG: carboxylesterase [Desulfofustis sp.]|nr:carboxylesterase [Desulfofustis sp.]
MQLLSAIEQETSPDPNYCVIWLHGLGADGNDFAPIVPHLKLPENLAVRFIFPHAPEMPVTVNGGMIMPAWYDIIEMEIDRRVDIEGLISSAAMIDKFVDRELERGLDEKNIIIAGFSQGGAVAYHLALNRPVRLGGLLAMSSYCPTCSMIHDHTPHVGLPIEIHHGLYDPVVPERLGREARGFMEEHGYAPVYRTYPMEHNVCAEQIEDIGAWFRVVMV